MTDSTTSTPGGERHLVVMGVTGVGKTTVAVALAEALDWPFCEGDDLHPQANVEKMAAGEPLTDDDRAPWLERLAGWTRQQHAAGRSTVLTCSALRRRYREVLAAAAPGTHFVHLVGEQELVLQRMRVREGHFMPTTLLESQVATLEPLAPDEQGVAVRVEDAPEEIVRRVLDELDLRPAGPPAAGRAR